MSIDERTVSSGLRIRSHQGDYDVTFFDDASTLAGSFATVKDAFVVVDETVHRLYPALFSMFDPARIFTIAATEENKTLSGVERVATFVQQGGASRASTLVVIGGGIVQDIGTFVAHIYYRGVPYIYVPTTLLSMADSCIGAKCGVNLGPFKNQLGFFQSPVRVAMWPGFLETLPPNDVRSGFGEVLKLSITAGDEAFDWFERRMSSEGFGISTAREAIQRSLETKKTIIEKDEYERDLRKILNYGHTFGHALESVTHNEVPHGLAVAWGVDVANFVAAKTGLLAPEVYDRIHLVVASNFRFEVTTQMDATRLLEAMQKDKKAASGRVSLVLPKAIGRLDLVPTDINLDLQQAVHHYLSDASVCSSATNAS